VRFQFYVECESLHTRNALKHYKKPVGRPEEEWRANEGEHGEGTEERKSDHIAILCLRAACYRQDAKKSLTVQSSKFYFNWFNVQTDFVDFG